MSVSIIIPTLDDEQALEKLLATLRSWSESVQEHIAEIIVVDASANLRCKALCQKYSATWLSYKKNRGAQLKFGAAHAKAATLWFLHADANIESKMLEEIINLAQQGMLGGFFKFKFNPSNHSLSQKIISYFTNWRSQYFTAYGDQGIFVQSDFYNHCGGHSDQALFEEVRLIKALRKSKKLHISNTYMAVSTRRWEQDGYWSRTIHNRFLAIAYKFGVSSEKLAQWYSAKKVQ